MPDTSAPTASSQATNNQSIDGLLYGRKWAGSITYSAPNALGDYEADYFDGFGGFNTNSFSAFTAQQMAALHFALKESGVTAAFSVAGFTNLDITFIGNGSGDGTVRGANMADANPTAYAFYPDKSPYGGDTFFGTRYDGTSHSLKTPESGNWAWHTMLHEIGHTLGLKHGHEKGGVAGALPSKFDSLEFTIMTYRTFIGQSPDGYTYERWGAPQTYMMLDIAALQYLYGANFNANGGDTIYEWRPNSGNTWIDDEVAISPGNNRIFATIWDGGGTDIYDLSAYSTNLRISLEPGEGSIFSKTQLADLGGGPNGGHARANIFNALLFEGDLRSLIENAIGGSGKDTILGNRADNVLTGNNGNDVLYGRGSDDTLEGSEGNDTLKGGGGDDLIDGGAGKDTALYAGNGVTVDLANAGPQDTGGAGTDTLVRVENLTGGEGDDWLTGNEGNNVLKGGGGDDTLRGGDGRDSLDGGAGRDILKGDAGADRFDFNAIKHSKPGSSRDKISDFSPQEDDLIDLRGIDANTKKDGNQKFKFIGDDKFSKTPGELRFDDMTVQGDVNGDGRADFEIRVKLDKLSAGDFIL
jgi:serralysin